MPTSERFPDNSHLQAINQRIEPLKWFELPTPRTQRRAVLQFLSLAVVAAVLTSLLLLPGVLGASVAAAAGIADFNQLPGDLKIQEFAQNSTLYAKQGGQDVPIAQFYAQNRRDVGWADIAQSVKDAAVAVEDPRFYSEGAVDLFGTIRGALSTLVGGSLQGGSSITQQYVKNVEVEKCEALTDQKKVQACYDDAAGATLQRKIQEMRYAVGLGKKYSKKDILLGYLNVVGFGGQVYGIQAAAAYYFGVAAKDLTLPQAATLVAMVNNPANLRVDEPGNKDNGAANGYELTRDRRDYVLDRMYVNHKITAADRDAAQKTPVQPAITPSSSGCAAAAHYNAAFFCDYVRDVILNDSAYGKTSDDRWGTLNRGGLKIYTTLNLDLQAVAQQSLSKYIPASRSGIDLGASNVSVELGTGRIVTMVQNRAFNNTDQPADGTTAVNYNTDEAYGGSQGFQTGSTFKAFDLAAWLEAGHSLYESVDASQHLFPMSDFSNSCGSVSGPPWPVQNDEGSANRLSVMSATAESVNSAFAMMATKTDLCSILKAAKSLGVHTAATRGTLNSYPSMILGTNTVSPLTMAIAYAGIANGGSVCTPVAIDKVLNADGTEHKVSPTTCTQGLGKDIAADVDYALQGVMKNGTATSANPWDGTPVLGKTGTTDDSLQNWLITSTTKVAQATWVGNVSGSTPLRSLSFHGIGGGNVKFSIVKPIQKALDKVYGGVDFPKPGDIALYGNRISVPDVSGKTFADARDLLQGLGLVVAADPIPVMSYQPAGMVAGTDPAAGTMAEAGASITIQVSSGQGPAVPTGPPTDTPTPQPTDRSGHAGVGGGNGNGGWGGNGGG
ncbi:penicillin-binding protein [Leifsonia xyli subsp. cynodontis DSM 46306]|uniref:PASTA domain-containing protein n=1 Tax=Leifsonia xyli subsp. cynodontis DSM 46306 TaxID=1389489 RepID=U3PEM9_LEIXC|nr:penicillin-binding protein [Leifsonia xyli]AGW42063.1 penicillin-binding protein [Leifsonia xyli subsp. cynodontis DSM 46306]